MKSKDKTPAHPICRIITASTAVHYVKAAGLFQEYADSLDFDLDFQDFESEMTRISVIYGPPDGRLILAETNAGMAGCVALRKFTSDICEMKRLFVRPPFRNKGLGRLLAREIIEAGKCMGYKRMRLDTVASMPVATALYISLGFVPIAPYRYNPLKGAQFFEKNL